MCLIKTAYKTGFSFGGEDLQAVKIYKILDIK